MLRFDPLQLKAGFSMNDLILHAGPTLVARTWETDGKHEDGRWREVDVTDCAHERLFEFVTMDSAVTVGDIFRLLDASPLLQRVFRRDFAEELCAEARKWPVTAANTTSDSAADERIEYLELYQQWSFDTATCVYGSTQRLQLHGIGIELQEDSAEHGRKKGERIHWSISLTPLRELLPLPLLVNPEVQITEDDLNAKAYGDEITRARHPDVTLGQVVHGVLWELSFHGAPEMQSDVMEELKSRVAEVDAGTVQLVQGTSSSRNWTVLGARRSSMTLEVGQHEKSVQPFGTSATMRMRQPGWRESSRVRLSSSRSSETATAESSARHFAPRGGEGGRMKKVVLADQDRIESYEGTAREFFRSVLDMDHDECVVTDESRLSDFSSCGLPDGLSDEAKGLKELYAVWDAWVVQVICERYCLAAKEVSPTILLVELLEKIERQRHRWFQ